MTSASPSATIPARAPQLCKFTVAPPALAAFPDMDRVEEALTAAAREHHLDALGFAMLGNLLIRQGRYFEAVEAYGTATKLDPEFASAH